MVRFSVVLFLGWLLLPPVQQAFAQPRAAAQDTVVVFKSRSCGCCNDWVRHLRSNGFREEPRDVNDIPGQRAKLGVPQDLGSCHTATVGGYAIEGHVPAADIRRLLKAKARPRARGLAVPGMPLGSPGMEGPRKDPYETLLFQPDGGHVVFERH